jgi:hypothetical protein
MESLISIAMIAGIVFLGVWLITSARFRKTIGNSVTDTVTVHSGAMVENAKFARIRNKVDAIQDLADDGLSKEAVAESIASFDELIKGV